MGAGHAHALHLPGSSYLHRLAPQCKIVATLLFVLAVVSTPREQFWAYGMYAAMLLALAVTARLPVLLLVRRLTFEAPFVAFAFLLPLIAGGERIDVGPLSLSANGLWGAWNILVKGTLGVGASLLLTATTSVPGIIQGLERLHVPRALTAIITFMVRYGDVIVGEMHRMRIARLSRGHDPRWIWQARAVAHSAASLFIRSYERGERVYLAMLSRGYEGALPRLHEAAASSRQWVTALTVPACAALVSCAGWMLQP